MGSCCCLLLVACIRDDELAGIDGSGKTPIPDPGDEVALGVKQPLVAQGAINGFGSVIIHGKHFDTSEADFYRHGKSVTEAAFEVGDMVTLSGYTNEKGEMFAEKVFFESSVTGTVDNYERESGIASILGQRVHIDAETVIGTELSDIALAKRQVTVSGWLSGREILATRITPMETPELNQVRGYIREFDPVNQYAVIGGLTIDVSGLSEPFAGKMGDSVLFEGKLIQDELFEGMPCESDTPNYLLATSAYNYSTALQANENPVEFAIITGVVGNQENTRFWVNDVEVRINQQTIIEPANIAMINSGDRVVVEGVSAGATQMTAQKIAVKSRLIKKTLTGVITEQLDNPASEQYILLGAKRIRVNKQTAFVDLQREHSRLAFESLNMGDYIVTTVTPVEDELVALSIKRTKQGVNDRKFDGTDELPYEWGFELGEPSDTDPNENLLFSSRLVSVDQAANRLTFAKGVARVKVKGDFGTEVYNESGELLDNTAVASVLSTLLAEQPDRVIWINMQGDLREGAIFIDAMSFRLDWQGREIWAEPIVK